MVVGAGCWAASAKIVCCVQVLTYGVASAAVLRLVVIALGTELVENFRYVNLGFAAFLLLNAAQILSGKEDESEDLSEKWIVRACRSGPCRLVSSSMLFCSMLEDRQPSTLELPSSVGKLHCCFGEAV